MRHATMTWDATPDEREQVELSLLLDGVHRLYGLDFRDYARNSVRRRVWSAVRSENLPSISALTERVLHDGVVMNRLLKALSVNVTSMFRDPPFFQAFREHVVPHLRASPFVRIWHAGCSTGEEVYSMAILLHEEGLLERSRLYATDMNPEVLSRAREGIFPLQQMREYTANYLAAGGKATLSDYYTSGYEGAVFRRTLRRNVVFAQHNLVTDGSFNEFNVILCRNVLIYFESTLQDRVHQLFLNSLKRKGILALGKGETVRHSAVEEAYEPLVEAEKIYWKQS